MTWKKIRKQNETKPNQKMQILNKKKTEQEEQKNRKKYKGMNVGIDMPV